MDNQTMTAEGKGKMAEGCQGPAEPYETPPAEDQYIADRYLNL